MSGAVNKCWKQMDEDFSDFTYEIMTKMACWHEALQTVDRMPGKFRLKMKEVLKKCWKYHWMRGVCCQEQWQCVGGGPLFSLIRAPVAESGGCCHDPGDGGDGREMEAARHREIWNYLLCHNLWQCNKCTRWQFCNYQYQQVAFTKIQSICVKKIFVP